MTEPQTNELARTIARQAELAREHHDFMKSSALFDVALSSLQGQSRGLRRWCLAHRGAARAALGDFDEANSDFERASELYSAPEKEKEDAYTWLLAQRGELHRLCAAQKLTPTVSFERYCREIGSAVGYFQQAIERQPDNPWICMHYAATATLAYWYGFSVPEWRTPIAQEGFPERSEIRALFERGLAARPKDWWGKTFQVIYYVVEYPAQFNKKEASEEWLTSMQRWWTNYELAMDLAEELDEMGMRPYAALAGRAMATGYGLAWHDAVELNLGSCPTCSPDEQRLLDKARAGRGLYMERALTGCRALLAYCPDDMFGNLAMGAVLRSQCHSKEPNRQDAAAYLTSLRRLSVLQSFITGMLVCSTQKWELEQAMSAGERSEFAAMHRTNSRMWSLLSEQEGSGEPNPTAGPCVPDSLELAVLRNLLFPGHDARRRGGIEE